MAKQSKNFIARRIDNGLAKLFDAFGFLFRRSLSVISSFTGKIYEIREKSKDLLNCNIKLAHEHLQNNRLFDATLRYKIVLKMDKNNFDALCGLGYIYFIKRKFNDAASYLKKALDSATTEEDKKDVEEYLHLTILEMEKQDKDNKI